MLTPADFRPKPLTSTSAIDDVLNACAFYAGQARQTAHLRPDAIIIMKVPYQPDMLNLFAEAEPVLLAEHHIEFDWTDWQVWTVPKSWAAGYPDVDNRAGIQSHSVTGEPRIWVVAEHTMNPEEARALAALILLQAEQAQASS